MTTEPRFRVVKGAGVLFDRHQVDELESEAEQLASRLRILEAEVSGLRSIHRSRLASRRRARIGWLSLAATALAFSLGVLLGVAVAL